MSNRINITPDRLPWWRRILGLGRPAAEIQRDLEAAVEACNKNADHIEHLAKYNQELLARRDRKRALAWPKPAVRMPRPKVLAEFAAPLDQGWQLALHQELDDYMQDLLDQVSGAPSATITEGLRLHIAGGIEHLRLFQKELLNLHDEAGRRDAEIEEKEDE